MFGLLAGLLADHGPITIMFAARAQGGGDFSAVFGWRMGVCWRDGAIISPCKMTAFLM